MPLRAPISNLKLLIVDDDQSIRTLVSRLASGWGYDSDICESAESALEKLQHARYNIVLTDIKMGKMDGITFAEKVREELPSIAVVIMTGAPTTKTAKKSQNMGAIYYLQKPLDIDKLGQTLRISAAWNIGMLTDRAARRFMSLRKGTPSEIDASEKNIKFAIKKCIAGPHGVQNLRSFVYDRVIDKNPLLTELKDKFPASPNKPF